MVLLVHTVVQILSGQLHEDIECIVGYLVPRI